MGFLTQCFEKIKEISLEFCLGLEKKLKAKKIKAEVFIGGSLAKGTLIKKDKYDIDIFIRFDEKYRDKDISGLLESAIEKKARKIHGSRDYYQIARGNTIIEIIPVIKIKKPEEAGNITDLSYFHVNYVKRNLNEKMRKEVLLLKKFFKAAKVYGAESYINGFSGYGAECLIIVYKSFEKALKELLKVKENIGVELTESLAMWPAASVSGYYFGNENAKYFGVGKITEEQVKDFALRKNMDFETAKKF